MTGVQPTGHDAFVAEHLPLPLSRRSNVGVAPAVELAVRAAGWSGVVLPLRPIWGLRVYPVVELDREEAAGRLASGQGPECSLETLSWWMGWPKGSSWQPPTCPIRLVGVVSDAPWRVAYSRVRELAGLGPGLVIVKRPTNWALLEADAAGVWVCRTVPGGSELLVRGAEGPVATASQTAHGRLVREQLFAELIRS